MATSVICTNAPKHWFYITVAMIMGQYFTVAVGTCQTELSAFDALRIAVFAWLW